jgi:hypothetical protein
VTAVTRHPDQIAAGPNVRAVGLDATDPTALATLARDPDVLVTATRRDFDGSDAASSVVARAVYV